MRYDDTARAYPRLARLLPVALAACLAWVSTGFAQTGENVAVVINLNSPDSIRVGEYYARKRAVPADNVIRLKTVVQENIDRALYAATIENPIAAALSRQALQDRILYIVLARGMPLRILGNVGPQGTVSSVDSELALLYRRMTGQPVPPEGRVENPYFLGSRAPGDARPFTHREHDIFLVTRLDAFTVEEAIALIDRGSAPSRDGRIVLDQQNKLFDRTGETWLEAAAERLKAQGHAGRVLLETTSKGVRDVRPVLGYYSWGSNDPNNRVRRFNLGFVPGSIAAMFVSTDGRTFREPPAEWAPTGDQDKSKWFGGTPQSLIGDLIREGVTGVAGHVAEPFLESTIRPEILFPAYVAGRNLAEAFYLAMPHLSWQTVVVGDPLCAPFAAGRLTRAQIEDPIDAEMQLPGLFAARRLAHMKERFTGAPERAATLAVRGEALINRGHRDEGRRALEQSSELAPQNAAVHLQLALLYEQLGEHDDAEARYRKVIALEPKQAIALNNLAYSLAVRRKAPAEALPLARRAVEAAPQHPALNDTLALTEHLLGNHAAAAAHIATAVRGAPGAPQIRLHAAMIYAAGGQREKAEEELRAALTLAPGLKDSDEFKNLQAHIDELGASSPR